MRKVILVLMLIILLSGTGLLFISLSLPMQTIEIPVTFGDAQKAIIVITMPQYLRLGDSASMQVEISFIPELTSDVLKSIKLKTTLVPTQLEVIPIEAFTAILPANGNAEFKWKIVPHSTEEQRATLWCFAQGSSGLELILAREISFPVKSFLEMKFSLARWILGEVILICLVLTVVTLYRLKRE